VLTQEPSNPGKGMAESPVDPGSPAMQMLDVMMSRLEYAHQMVNEIHRRAAL
jgi:hypothetical protein